MDRNLFRQEVIEHQNRSFIGNILIIQPLSFSLWVLFFTLLLIGIIILLFNTSISRKERVRGFIEPTTGVVKIKSDRQGFIRKLEKQVGDKVVVGEAIAWIESPKHLATNLTMHNQLNTNLEKHITFLEKQIELANSKGELEKLDLEQQLLSLDKQIQLQKLKISSHKKKIKLVEKRNVRNKKLTKQKLLSSADVELTQNELLQTKLDMQEAESRLDELHQSKKQIASQLEQLPLALNLNIQEIRQRIQEVENDQIEVESQFKQIILSPVEGRIATLQIKQGQQITPQQLLVVVLPDGAEFESILMVPARAVGFLKKGLPVKLRYDAFPYQRYGIYGGVIKDISESILLPNENLSPIILSEPAYKISVTLEHQTIKFEDNEFVLAPGMTLEADIILDEYSILEWILKPLHSIRGL